MSKYSGLSTFLTTENTENTEKRKLLSIHQTLRTSNPVSPLHLSTFPPCLTTEITENTEKKHQSIHQTLRTPNPVSPLHLSTFSLTYHGGSESSATQPSNLPHSRINEQI
ncbi:MAG: hypothetical protein PHO32_09965 [Candidatus Cloacimonetes bacterium]|nr:hypothetical protein [Candidatus Cloacimonadota bacterium]